MELIVASFSLLTLLLRDDGNKKGLHQVQASSGGG